MGEIADQIIDGDQCEVCGDFFNDQQGYPATCWPCWKEMTKEERDIHTKAWENPNGH